MDFTIDSGIEMHRKLFREGMLPLNCHEIYKEENILLLIDICLPLMGPVFLDILK